MRERKNNVFLFLIYFRWIISNLNLGQRALFTCHALHEESDKSTIFLPSKTEIERLKGVSPNKTALNGTTQNDFHPFLAVFLGF